LFSKVVKVIAAAMLLIAADMVFEINFPVVREIKIHTEKLKKGKEILLLQISDVHGSASGEIARKILKEALKIRPAAVLVTGDLVDEATKDFNNVYKLIKGLHSICPEIFFVSGNHEWNNDGRRELLTGLQGLGVKLLNNKSTVVTVDGIAVNICGVDDPYRRKDNIEKAMKGADGKRYSVLLAHSPRIRDRLGSYAPDLILCGHTHGGQVRLPFVGAVIAPGEGLFPEFNKGKYNLHNGSLLYIDSGVGTSKLPIRFLNRSQISLIRIEGTGNTDFLRKNTENH